MQLHPPHSQRYRILGTLGAGAQAQVFRAVDARSDQAVALKLLSMDSQGRARARFLREARALSSFQHPHLTRFVDVHLDHDPPILVMELVEGRTLASRIRARDLMGQDAVRRLGRDLASALAYVHAKGVVHRDVKPENVVLTERGPVLVDLGLAKASTDATLTATGAAVGTPAYLAPEVLAQKVAGREADVFALGVLLHEALTGERPFNLLDLTRASLGEELPPEPAAYLAELFGPAAGASLAANPTARPDAAGLEDELRRGGDGGTPSEPLALPAGRVSGPRARIAGDEATPARTPRVLLGLGLLGAFLLGALAVGRDLRPLPSLQVTAAPRSFQLSWEGAEGGVDLELRAGRTVLARLAAGEGRQTLRLPLTEVRELTVTRGGRPVASGTPPRERWTVEPASPPEAARVRITRGREGLELCLPRGPGWTPERLRFRQGDVAWSQPAQEGPSEVRYPLRRTLDGDLPLEVFVLARSGVEGFEQLGEEPWWTLDLAPHTARVASPQGKGELWRPVEAMVEATENPPVPRSSREAGGVGLVRVSDLYLPGPRRVRLGREDAWFSASVDPTGGGALLVGHRPGRAPWKVPLADPAFFGRDYHVVPLAEGLGMRVGTVPEAEHWGSRWVAIRAPREGGPMTGVAYDLEEGGFKPRAGPFETLDGGAFVLDHHLRTRSMDGRGVPQPVRGVVREVPFFPRPGAQTSRSRLLVLAGYWVLPDGTRRHCLLGFDRGQPGVTTCVDGLPSVPSLHPAVIEEGPRRGVWWIQGDRLVRLPLEVFQAPAEAPQAPRMVAYAQLEAGGELHVQPLAEAPDPKLHRDLARGNGAAAGGFGVLPFFDSARDEHPGPPRSVLGQAVSFQRWRLAVLGPPGVATLDLGDADFPVFGEGHHKASADLDPARGLAVVLSDGARERFTLSLVSLDPPGELIAWHFRPIGPTQGPALTPGEVVVPMFPARLTSFPLPPGLAEPRERSAP